jgi:DNA repair protein RadA
MVDSPHHPEQEVIFALGEAGVIDPDSDTKKKSTKISPKSEPDKKSTKTSKSDIELDNKTENDSVNTE